MEIRNNRVNILLSCLVALTTWCFTACDDPMGGDTVPALGFPTDTLVVDALPGDTVSVSFEVGYNWKLNSDREWCRVNGEDKSFGGKAGANTVNFVVSDLGNLFEDDEATITLHMNNEKRVIAIITRRSTKDYDVQVKLPQGKFKVVLTNYGDVTEIKDTVTLRPYEGITAIKE